MRAEDSPEGSLERLRSEWGAERDLAKQLKRQALKARDDAEALLARANERLDRAEAGMAEAEDALKAVKKRGAE